MNAGLNALMQIFQNADQAAVYCAGEFASFLVQYCSLNGFAHKIVACVVTKRDMYTPAHILGIPVIELEYMDWHSDMPIIVANLSEQSRQEIKHSLIARGYHDIYLLSEREYRDINESLSDYSADIKCEIKRLIVQNRVQYENLSRLIQSMPLVVEAHKQSFDKYKDINKGRIVVICAPGPSINQYAFHDDYVHIGLNSMLFNDRIKLDYYFIQHIPSEYNFWGNGFDVNPLRRKKYIENIPKLKCVKFIGQLIGNMWNTSPPFGEFSNGSYNNYYISDMEVTHNFCADIRYGFLHGARSVIFPALQFALFTNPDKILIAGSDGYSVTGANYYSKKDSDYLKEAITVDRSQTLLAINDEMEKIYKEFRKFAIIRYPNTEILMVNPVRYKGIFKELTTDPQGQIIW